MRRPLGIRKGEPGKHMEKKIGDMREIFECECRKRMEKSAQ